MYVNIYGRWSIVFTINFHFSYVPAQQTRYIYMMLLYYQFSKHTTTLFPLSHHYIISREWRVLVDQVEANYHGRLVVL